MSPRQHDLEEDLWDDGSEAHAEPGDLLSFLSDPLGMIRRRRIWIAAVLALGAVATGVLFARWKPVYVATSTVLLTSQQIPEDFVRSTVREDSIENVNAMIGKVLSQANLARIIEETGIESARRETLAETVARVRGKIDISPLRGYSSSVGAESLIYGVSFESRSREQAADVANALAGLFVETSIARRNEQAQRATAFLRRELERDQAELRELSREITEFRRANRGQLPDELNASLAKLELLSQKRQALTLEIAEKRNRISLLASQREKAEPTESEVLLDQLRRDLARESAVNTDEHPNVIALRERIARLEESIREESRPSRGANASQVRAAQGELELLEMQLAKLDEQIDDLNERIDRTPAVAEELKALEERERVLREDYVESMRKVGEAELAESLESAQQGGQVSILDPAQLPGSARRPRWLVLVLGLVGSFALAGGVAVLLELVDPVVLSERQLAGLGDGAVLGAIPAISPDREGSADVPDAATNAG